MPTKNSKPTPTGKPTAAQTHTFRVALQDEPAIVREFEIVSSRTLVDLANAIVSAFDFEFDHAFGFYSNLTEPHARRSGTSYELFTWARRPTLVKERICWKGAFGTACLNGLS